MPEGQQDHRGVAVTVAVALGGFDKRLDFGRGKVFALAQFGVRPTQRAGRLELRNRRRDKPGATGLDP
jgi:hypothetical protein